MLLVVLAGGLRHVMIVLEVAACDVMMRVVAVVVIMMIAAAAVIIGWQARVGQLVLRYEVLLEEELLVVASIALALEVDPIRLRVQNTRIVRLVAVDAAPLAIATNILAVDTGDSEAARDHHAPYLLLVVVVD